MKRTIRHAFTLTEMLLAVVAAAVVFCAAAIILAAEQRLWNRALQQAALQRDASVAMVKIMQVVKPATSAVIEDSGTTLTIHGDSGWTKVLFVPDQSSVAYQAEGQEPETLLNGVVQSATFTVQNGAVTVGIHLLRGQSDARLSHTTLMRNRPVGT